MSLLAGCAVRPVTSFHTYKDLQVELSSADGKMYALVGKSGRRLSEAGGRGENLILSLPEGIGASGCFYVADHKGRNIYGEGQYFGLPLIQEYRGALEAKVQLESAIEAIERAEDEYRLKHSSAVARLEANRAFDGQACSTPDQKPLPPKPNTKCETEWECREEGAAICFSQFLGAEGCSIALKELGISGLLSGPGCAAAAAELAGEKYDMDDVVVDALQGLVDDAADWLLERESFFGKLLGGGAKTLNYNLKVNRAKQCTHDFVSRFYGPQRKWLESVGRVKREPARAKKECQSIRREVARFYEKKKALGEEKAARLQEFEDASVKYKSLLAARRPVSPCREESAGGRTRARSAERPVIEPETLAQKKVNAIRKEIRDGMAAIHRYLDAGQRRLARLKVEALYLRAEAYREELPAELAGLKSVISEIDAAEPLPPAGGKNELRQLEGERGAARNEAIEAADYRPSHGYLLEIVGVRFPEEIAAGESGELHVKYYVISPDPREELIIHTYTGMKYGDQYIGGGGPKIFKVPFGGGIVVTTVTVTFPREVPEGIYWLEVQVEDAQGRFGQSAGTSTLLR